MTTVQRIIENSSDITRDWHRLQIVDYWNRDEELTDELLEKYADALKFIYINYVKFSIDIAFIAIELSEMGIDADWSLIAHRAVDRQFEAT